MDYTTSLDNVVHAGTGNRMHADNTAVPTAVSGNDMNMVIWSLMAILKAAEIEGKPFNPDDPASYDRVLTALQALFVTQDQQATEALAGTAKVATQALTNQGTDDRTFITPKKLYNWAKQATEAVLGLAKVATQAQVEAGADDATIVTPKKLRFGFATQFGTNGYVILPKWLGGLIIQWGLVTATGVSGDITVVPYPIRFPSACFVVVGNRIATGSNAQMNVYSAGGDPTGQVLLQNFASSPELASYIAIGR